MDYQPQDPVPGGPDPNQAPYQPPPAGGYTPPPGGYAPPPSDPSGGQQAYQPAGGGYGGGYQAPPKKAGFNWLACCGIGCGVTILLTVIVCALMWKVIAPMVGVIGDAAKVAEEVQKTDLPTIQASATEVDDAALAASPDAYKGQWIKLTAVLGDEKNASSNASGTDGTSYVTQNFVMITDTSNTARVGLKGDSVVAYGKVMIMDLGEMLPMLKEEMEKEMSKEGGMPGGTKFTILIAKSVELAGADDGNGEEAPADDAPAEEAPADGGG